MVKYWVVKDSDGFIVARHTSKVTVRSIAKTRFNIKHAESLEDNPTLGDPIEVTTELLNLVQAVEELNSQYNPGWE